MRLFARICLLAGLAALVGCSSAQVGSLQTAELHFNKGRQDLEKKRYLKAIEHFQLVVSNFPGSPLVSDSQFYLAESYFGSKDYVSAVFEYQRLLDGYPYSKWVDKASYNIAESYYRQRRRPELDQKETMQALSYYRIFLDDYPDSPLVEKAAERIKACRERLAHKSFLNCRLYQRRGHWDAAAMAYRELLLAFPETVWYFKAAYELALVHDKKGEEDKARSLLQEVVAECKDQELKDRAQERLEQLPPPPGPPMGDRR